MERACKKSISESDKFFGFGNVRMTSFRIRNFSERQYLGFGIFPNLKNRAGPHLFRRIRLEMFRRLRHALRRPPHARMVPFLLLTEAEALQDHEVSVTTAHTHTQNEIFTGIRRPEPGGRPRFLDGLACGAACCIAERSPSADKRESGCVCVCGGGGGEPRNRRK